jgi:tetratricopeptide (TPR) repeat protein
MSKEQESRESTRREELSQEGTEPNQNDVERVEEAARAIARAIETASDDFWAAQVEATKPKNRLIGSIMFVASTWVVFFALLSGLTLLVGIARYDVGPFHTLERVGREQKQAEKQESLAKLHVDLGNSLLNVGQAKEAKAEFERALELDPFNRSAEMGTLKSELFESVEAEEYDSAVIGPKLDELVKERPDTHVYAFRGTLRYFEVIPPDRSLPEEEQAKPYQPALSDLKQAVKRNASNAYAYDSMGSIYYDLGQFDEYLEMAEKAYRLSPRDPLIKHDYANALYANKRYNDAIKEYDEIRFMDEQYMWAYHDLAQVCRLIDVTDKNQYVYYLSYSQRYYEQFIAMLEDKEFTSLEKNQAAFTFTTGPNSYPVTLYENPEMRYYAYYGIALTSYLQERPEEAESYVSKAEAIQIDPALESEVKKLLEYDINLLQEEQQWLRGATAFSKKYLPSSNLSL